ncbi:MAG: hypothetical protein AAFO06_14960 [Cyanobacteria bacterium J06597_16]
MHESLGGVLGVLFHEAVRIYRCILAEKPVIPSAGFGLRGNTVIYVLVILVFIAVAIFFTEYFAQGNSVASLFFGFGIPSGSRLISPVAKVSQAEGEKLDDFWSEENRPPSLSERFSRWLSMYSV